MLPVVWRLQRHHGWYPGICRCQWLVYALLVTNSVSLSSVTATTNALCEQFEAPLCVILAAPVETLSTALRLFGWLMFKQPHMKHGVQLTNSAPENNFMSLSSVYFDRSGTPKEARGRLSTIFQREISACLLLHGVILQDLHPLLVLMPFKHCTEGNGSANNQQLSELQSNMS